MPAVSHAVALVRLCFMIYAISDSREKIKAVKGAVATCPECSAVVIPKCGKIKIWHWSHTADTSCDGWGEEGEWHTKWKLEFDADRVEYVIERGGEKHRADFCSPKGLIVEFQHSSISVEEIEKRENFYGFNMLWVFDLSGRLDVEQKFWLPDGSTITRPRFEFKSEEGDYRTFRWRQPRKSLKYAKRTMFFDLGDGLLFKVGKIYLDEPPCGGWGHVMMKHDFLEYVDPLPPPPPLPPPQGSLF